MFPVKSFAGRIRFLPILCHKDSPSSLASKIVMSSILPVSSLNFFAFLPRITGVKVSFKNIIPNTKVNPIKNTSTHITQRQVVRRQMNPAMIGARVGARGGPAENTATAFPRSFDSHISASTPAPIASGAPPPSPERKRKMAS
jgi:hypothetical protein